MNKFMYAYNNGSASAKLLKRALGTRLIKHTGSRFRASPNKTVINWGCSNIPPDILGCHIINQPSAVCVAANKIDAFNAMADKSVNTVPFTTDRDEALEWARSHTVFCRTVLTGHSGSGIIIHKPTSEDPLPEAPLYTRWIKSSSEWRVHVYRKDLNNITAFYTQRKVRDSSREPSNWLIRSHDNGFVFQQNNDNIPSEILVEAAKAIDAIGLDFGAVDVIMGERTGHAHVLEVNTAPGLTGESVNKYVEMLNTMTNGGSIDRS